MPKYTPGGTNPETWKDKIVVWPTPLSPEDRAAVEVLYERLHGRVARGGILRGLVRLGTKAAQSNLDLLAPEILKP